MAGAAWELDLGPPLSRSAQEVKEHPFFHGTDWQQVYLQKVRRAGAGRDSQGRGPVSGLAGLWAPVAAGGRALSPRGAPSVGSSLPVRSAAESSSPQSPSARPLPFPEGRCWPWGGELFCPTASAPPS